MRIAVLPFNATEGTKPAYGRQFAAFASEQLRAHTDADVNVVSYLTQIPDEEGQTRMAFVNLADGLLPYEQLTELFEQAEVDEVMDGTLQLKEDEFEQTVRFHAKDNPDPVFQETITYPKGDLFLQLHRLVRNLADRAQVGVPEFLAGETMEFGTDDPQVFLEFLEGHDALNYIQQSNGQVAKEFSPQVAIDALLAAAEKDADFEGPYQVLVQLCRACAHYRVGNFEMLHDALTKLAGMVPEAYEAHFGLGEIHFEVQDFAKAADHYEKAISIKSDEPALIARLGLAQLNAGMPVNAERNFRRAMEMEGEDKPSADLLAMVLQQTGRGHEVPGLWKSGLEANPQDAGAHTKYALALFQTGRQDDAAKAFETALETLEDENKPLVKRYYAPILVQSGDLDRAMDFYEDCLEVAPDDVPLMLEYAETLEQANRAFEVPRVLREVLAHTQDQDIQAQTQAKLIELEQPKRAEAVDAARAKMEAGDFEGAVRDLRPLRTWLGDYWKLWALLSAAHNRLEQYAEAEETAGRLLQMFPGCEPAYGEMVQALGGQDRHEEAYNLMRYAAQNRPQSLPIFINLGLAARRAGHSDEARDLAKQIREAVGPNPDLDPVLAEMER